MAFRFPLATVMRLREIAEIREERLLGQILNQMAQCRRTLADLEIRQKHLLEQREGALQAKTSAAELHISHRQVRAVEGQQKTARAQLSSLELLRCEQVKIYEKAHRNHELLSTMREQQREIFDREQTRQEQSVMDDTFSSRRSLR